MKKSDLKTGMVVLTRSLKDYLVLRNTEFDDVCDLLWRPEGWLPLDRYTDDLLYNSACSDDACAIFTGEPGEILHEYDIVQVIQPPAPNYIWSNPLEDQEGILWTREANE